MRPFILNIGNVKPFSTIQEQIELLEKRGLIINNREEAEEILKRTGYYRFSAYSLTVKDKNDKYYTGVTFENIYELYRFDDAFRKIVMEFSSYIEISFRAYISYIHGEKYGPLGYMDSKNFEHPYYFAQMINKLSMELSRSDDVFVDHHKRKKEGIFPIWAALECSSFGELSKLYKNLKNEDKTYIAKEYFGLGRMYIENWLQASVYARNIAAHGGRFYNRRLKSVPVKLPTKYNGKVQNNTSYAIIYAIYKLQPTKELQSKLLLELNRIFNKYPYALKEHMGFPENWVEILESESKENKNR